MNEYECHYNAPQRPPVYAQRGVVCTSQNLAAQAGLDILKKGGNAIDAAIATAITLTVTEPVSNGIGGDAFAIVWTKDKEMFGLNASGPAPMAISAEELREKGYTSMPKDGWIPVNVPGIPSAWKALSERFGKLPFAELFGPAINLAENGYPVSFKIARSWGRTFDSYTSHHDDDPLFDEWFKVFAPDGHAPEAGEIWKSPLHAQTLRELAETGCESMYRGRLAEVIGSYSEATGGYLRTSDLNAYHPEWVQPISVNYRGYDVWEIPPNGHGIVALMALNILKNFDIKSMDEETRLHTLMEAMKLAFADGQRYIADPRAMTVTPEQLLDTEYGKARASLITDEAVLPEAGDPNCHGTVYLCAADEEGNMISYIQSNYGGFGSGVVIPGTGIAMHNRGNNFSLDPASPNVIAPGKKPYHTIIPGFLTKDGEAVGPFGVMGGFMQPQGHVQVLTNMIDLEMDPQMALDAARWQWIGGNQMEMEAAFTEERIQQMKDRGHEITVPASSGSFGRGQVIRRTKFGTLEAATESRCDGCAATW